MPRRGGSGTAGRGFGSDPGFFENLTNNIGNFLSSDAAPVVLGQAAEAIMGGSPEGRQSWQSGLGRVASGLGQSRIASKAAQRQATERQGFSDMLTKFLTGRGGFTEPDADGPTDITFKAGGQGVPDKVTVTGNALMGGPVRTPEQLQQRGAGTAGTASPPKPAGTVRPTAPPLAPTPNSGLLPFNLAQAVTGSAGGSGDLFGLDPQQISNITAGDIAGGGLTNLSSRTLYNNLVRQAQEGYYNRMPQAKGVGVPKVSKTFKGADGNMWYIDELGNTRSTKTPYEPGMEGAKVIDQGDKVTIVGPGGTQTFSKNMTPIQQRQAGFQDRLMESGIAPEDANVGAIIAAGADPDIVTGGRSWVNKHRSEIANIKNKLLTDNRDKQGFSQDAQLVNASAPDETTSFVFWHSGMLSDNMWKETLLPKVNGRQMTMADARAEAQRQKVPLEVFLDDVYEHLKARGEL